MRLLLTADSIIPVPPVGYGGIERIVDSLAQVYRACGHAVGLVAHPESKCAVDKLYGWPGSRVTSARDTVRNGLALRRAARDFNADLVHSFSRLAYLLPLLPARLPKLMSYQRHTGGRAVTLAAKLGGASLRFTGCSEFICRMGRPAGGEWRAVFNFVELEKYTFVPAVPADAPLVFLSRVESIKGPDLAIAVARAAGRRLIIAGNQPEAGGEREFWRREIEPHLGRDGVEWVGVVNDAQKNELLGRAAAMIVPIQWDEPFGIVFAESLACGTPVITCARGALPEIIEDGLTGFFMDSVAGGVAAVRRLGSIRREHCRAAAAERFSAERCAGQYLRLYEEMIAAR